MTLPKVALGLVAVLLGMSDAARAQQWPDRPVKFISSQAAGGGTDMIGRLVADQLSSQDRPAGRL